MKDAVHKAVVAGTVVLVFALAGVGAGLGWFFWARHAAASRRAAAVHKLAVYAGLPYESYAYSDKPARRELNAQYFDAARLVCHALNRDVLEGMHAVDAKLLGERPDDDAAAKDKKAKNRDALAKAVSEAETKFKDKPYAVLNAEKLIARVAAYAKISAETDVAFKADERCSALLRAPSRDSMLSYVADHPEVGDRLAALIAAYESRKSAELGVGLQNWTTTHVGPESRFLSVLSVMGDRLVPRGNGGTLCYDDLPSGLRTAMSPKTFMVAGRGSTCVSLADGTVIASLRDNAIKSLASYLAREHDAPTKAHLAALAPAVGAVKADRPLASGGSAAQALVDAYMYEIYDSFGFRADVETVQ